MFPRKLLALGIATLGLPASGLAADFSGAWVIKSHPSPGLDFTLLCVITANGVSVSGPCVSTQGTPLHTSGHLSETKMRFKYSTDYNGSGVRLDYSGLVQPNGTVNGTVNAGSSNGGFNATKLIGSAADHSATWKVDVNINDQFKYVLVCTFRSEGERISGPCAVAQGSTLQASGTADASHLRLAYDTVYEGKPVHVDYTGTLQTDGSLAGAVKAGTAAGTFTAARQLPPE